MESLQDASPRMETTAEAWGNQEKHSFVERDCDSEGGLCYTSEVILVARFFFAKIGSDGAARKGQLIYTEE